MSKPKLTHEQADEFSVALKKMPYGTEGQIDFALNSLRVHEALGMTEYEGPHRHLPADRGAVLVSIDAPTAGNERDG